MPLTTPAYQTLGYTEEGRAVALSSLWGEIKIEALIEPSPLKGEIVKWLDKGYLGIALLPSTVRLLVRPLDIPLKSEIDVDLALSHEVEGLFPTPQGDLIYDRVLHPFAKGKTKATLLLSTRQAIEKQLDGEVITAIPVAIAKASHHFDPLDLPRLVFYSDPEQSYLVVEKKGLLLASLKIDQEQLSIQRGIGTLSRELGIPFHSEILTFKESLHPLPEPYLFKTAALPFDAEFVLPFGAALSGLVGQEGGINLREMAIPAPLPWIRTQKWTALLALSFLVSLLALYFAGEAYLDYKEDLLREKWSHALSLLGKTEDFIAELSPEEIGEKIFLTQKELAATPILFPFHPNLPKVSDLLAWLGTLEEVVGEEGRMEIVSLQYTMLKRPEMEKKQEKYQVKVDLEFTTQSPKWAREFHDLLITPNAFVDPKGEVKWNVQRGTYKTSFLLKDQTAYVH